MKINENYLNLQDSYLFSTVSKKVKAFEKEHPQERVIRLGIGDVTLPIPPIIADALKKASAEMAEKATFRGYGEEQGYSFLRDTLVRYYAEKGVSLTTNEIFVSDGAKSDLGNILDIFSKENLVLIPDPVYPVYVDTNIMAGRKIRYIDGTSENQFLPLPDGSISADIIYLCSPNNPTGAVYTKEQLKVWVDFALANNAVILFDAAYESFVQDASLPTSIFQIEGAKKCAIEFCSLSKTAGFTGIRCGYTVVPDELTSSGTKLNPLWLRRQTTKFNGVSYIVQRGAEAVFTPEGYKQCKANLMYYLENAKIIRNALTKANIWYVGGDHSPYVWMRCPSGMGSWEYFDYLLSTAKVVGTPGAGFGKNGEDFFRLSAFGDREDILAAVERITNSVK